MIGTKVDSNQIIKDVFSHENYKNVNTKYCFLSIRFVLDFNQAVLGSGLLQNELIISKIEIFF